MPIVSTAQVSYLITKLSFDMLAQEGRATLRKFVDGVPINDVDIVVTGEEFMSMVNTVPPADMTRGEDITDAVYKYAIANAGVQGSIV